MRLDQLYQEIILDHYKHPHGRGLREPYDAEAHHVNPTCGDEITLRVRVGDGVIDDVSYEGMGCSISQASASVLYELVRGRKVSDGAVDGRRLHRGDDEPGFDRTRRGRARRRDRVRRRGEVPGPGSSARCSRGWRSRTRWQGLGKADS
jgi:hypothetical protein